MPLGVWEGRGDDGCWALGNSWVGRYSSQQCHVVAAVEDVHGTVWGHTSGLPGCRIC